MGKKQKAANDSKRTELDSEASTKRTLVKSAACSEFECYRCSAPKHSKSKYEWQTTEGSKIVCNGCHGFLCSLSEAS